MENETTENIVVEDTTNNITYNEQLELIHNDLGFICCFLVVFVLFILLKYAYKFLDMFFKI